MSSHTKAKALSGHKASGFNLEYACSLSIRNGRSKGKTKSEAQRTEGGY